MTLIVSVQHCLGKIIFFAGGGGGGGKANFIYTAPKCSPY